MLRITKDLTYLREAINFVYHPVYLLFLFLVCILISLHLQAGVNKNTIFLKIVFINEKQVLKCDKK